MQVWQMAENIYNDQEAFDFSRSLGTFNFSSNGFRRTEKSNQIVGQAFTNFANGFSNEFTVGLTTTRFKRNPDVLAPQVLVQNIGGTGSGIAFRAGTENQKTEFLIFLRCTTTATATRSPSKPGHIALSPRSVGLSVV